MRQIAETSVRSRERERAGALLPIRPVPHADLTRYLAVAALKELRMPTRLSGYASPVVLPLCVEMCHRAEFLFSDARIAGF